MSTKGKSNLYGRGKRGKPDSKIGYKYAKYLSSNKELEHINKHGIREMNLTPNQYKSRAVAFANKVDEINHFSFTSERGLTYKYSLTTGEYAIITKGGIIATYFKIDEKRWERLVDQYEKR